MHRKGSYKEIPRINQAMEKRVHNYSVCSEREMVSSFFSETFQSRSEFMLTDASPRDNSEISCEIQEMEMSDEET